MMRLTNDCPVPPGPAATAPKQLRATPTVPVPALLAAPLILAMLLAAPPIRAEQDAAGESGRVLSPSMNSYYLDADPDFWRETFERDGRELYDKRRAILSALALQPGQRVADVGAGSGLFSLLFAREVGPRGLVYAVDISEPFTRAIAERAAQAGLDNIRTVVNDQHSLGLPDASVDLVFTADTYHHFEFPQAMLAAIRRALIPGGELIIIDFRTDPAIASAWVQGHVRAGRERVIAEVEAAGFVLEDDLDVLKRNYFLRFRAPES